MYQHVSEAKREGYTKRPVHYKILSILSRGEKIVYEKIDQPDEAAAFALEIELIKKYGRRDNGTGILSNLTDGGEGLHRSKESIERTAAKHRGMKRSEASRKRMQQAQYRIVQNNLNLYGTKKKPEAEAKRLAKRVGVPWSNKARATKRRKPTAKRVLAYNTSLQGIKSFVGEFESISDCARQLGCDPTAIWKICNQSSFAKSLNGKVYPYKAHHGYTFRYKDPNTIQIAHGLYVPIG